MSVITTIEVAADEFPLGGTITTNPDIEVTLECFAPLGSPIIPYIWVDDGTIKDIERVLRADDDIGSARVLTNEREYGGA